MKKYFEDKLDFEEFYTNGLALLERKYYKNAKGLEWDTSIKPKIIAKGITAYLSSESYSNYIDESLRLKLHDKKKNKIYLEPIFKHCFNNCFKFLPYHKKVIIISSENKKPEKELIKEYIQNEKQFFIESKDFYEEVRENEKKIINDIKEASLDYQKWVENKYLSDSEDNSDKEALNKKNQLTEKENQFSVLEWATIFYYANETKLLTDDKTVTQRIKEFIKKHQIDTTFDYFKNQYYKAKKRINDKNNYPIDKLEKIIPFLKEKYKQTVTKVENDILIIKEEQADY